MWQVCGVIDQQYFVWLGWCCVVLMLVCDEFGGVEVLQQVVQLFGFGWGYVDIDWFVGCEGVVYQMVGEVQWISCVVVEVDLGGYCLFCVVQYEVGQQVDWLVCGVFGCFVFLGCVGDVEMVLVVFVCKVLQEFGCCDGVVCLFGDVGYVGEIVFQVFGVVIVQWYVLVGVESGIVSGGQ